MNPPDSSRRFSSPILILSVRLAVGCLLVALVAPVSVDDYFRMFHALWWWEKMPFATSPVWLPGHSYFYGLICGSSNDTVIAPRMATLALQLLSGVAVILWCRRAAEGAAVPVFWLLFSPLALLLGTVPLAESLFFCLLLWGVLGLSRFLATGKGTYLLGSAACYLMAAAVRYEGWLLLPVFAWYATRRRAADVSHPIQITLAILPGFFPLVWIIYSWAVLADPVGFLRGIQEDHFGPGSLFSTGLGVLGAVSAVQALLVAILVARKFAGRLQRGASVPGKNIFEVHVAVSLGGVVVLALLGDIPSQMPHRMLFCAVVFGAIPVGRFFAGNRFTGRAGKGAWAAAFVLATFFVVATVNLPQGVGQENLDAADWIRDSFSRGQLSQGDVVLVAKELPDATALKILSNRSASVQLDELGELCPAQLLTAFDSMCPLPDWTPRVVISFVLRNSPQEEYLRFIRWKEVAAFGTWVAYGRVPGTPPVGFVRIVPGNVTGAPETDTLPP